jgi:adenine-specific DNA-methyltransferase
LRTPEGPGKGGVFSGGENRAYLTEQLITCIGNKRALLDFIGLGIKKICRRLGRRKLDLFDVFSGSGIVARYFKRFARLLVVNDLEKYSTVINRCYLANRDETDLKDLEKNYRALIDRLSGEKLKAGFITELYAPRDGENIRSGERVFYTPRNARYIDSARALIGEMPEKIRDFFLAPLLAEASVHANTSGVFKGFYKNRETGIGQFGGKNGDALLRIKSDISLPFPVFSNFSSGVTIFNGSANLVMAEAPEVDAAYLDPPYNQHPYGSNYFMLNLIAGYRRPGQLSRVSGIPPDWNRSDYNKRHMAYNALKELIAGLKARFVLVSFNSEGFISLGEMESMFKAMGRTEILEMRYNTFKGSRNLKNRDIHVTEYLYLLEKR